MNRLNKDALFQLATMLDLDDLLSLCQSNSEINNLLCNKGDIWFKKLENEFPDWREYFGNRNPRKVYTLLVGLTKLKEIFKYEDNIYQLFEETELDLTDRQIKVLPPEIGLLKNLEFLDLNNNQLVTLSPEIKLLTNLQGLYLGNNQITILPSEIRLLVKLQELSLDNNQITTFPPEIGLLTNLQLLYLSNNQITSLPPEIGSLTNLRELYLHNNQITTLPPEIGSLKNLWSLSLDKKVINIPSNLKKIL